MMTKIENFTMNYPVKEAIATLKKTTNKKFGISTSFGVADITKTEAIRQLKTCELDTVVLTWCHDTVILEYGE